MSLAAAIAGAVLVATPAAAFDVAPERITVAQAHKAMHRLYDDQAGSLNAKLQIGACRPHGRTWRTCRVRLDLPDHRALRYEVRVADDGEQFTLAARVLELR